MEEKKFRAFIDLLAELTPEQRKAIAYALQGEAKEDELDKLREYEKYKQMIEDIVKGSI